ncbi:MAG: hypothetical protein LBD16_07240 [Oscillospiraceae bacterium]|jgi:hypothetical protein|nr:hypothetical protein [Oscillospiraceae bacterium]
MLAWITQNIALILLILLLLILLVWAIKKLVNYYKTHICDWAAKRLAKCVPAAQCAANPMYVQAKHCPQVQYGAVHNRPVITYAAAPQCAPAPQATPVCSQTEIVTPVVKKVVKTVAPVYAQEVVDTYHIEK